MVRRRLAVVALAVPLLLGSVPACSNDHRPENKIATETVPLPGPPVGAGAGGPAKGKSKSQLPADKSKVD